MTTTSYPKVEDTMRLLAVLTGWSDQSLGVEIGYKRARVYHAHDESSVDNSQWGFVAATRICGIGDPQHRSIGAQGKTLEEALFNLALEVEKTLQMYALHHNDMYRNAKERLREFRADIEKSSKTDPPSKQGPYR